MTHMFMFETLMTEARALQNEMSGANWMSGVLNLTQHNASKEQVDVVDLPPKAKEVVRELLTLKGIPSRPELMQRAQALTDLALVCGAAKAMIGGHGALMVELDRCLREYGVSPLYAFSLRESQEKVMPDGSTRKVNVFRHLGFYQGVAPSGEQIEAGNDRLYYKLFKK